jgi:hypothetical protein
MKNRLPYEFRNYSQNLEDGIILELISRLKNKNNIAIEIGSGDGTENMVRNLVENHGYRAIGHDILKNQWHHENYFHCVGKIDLENLTDYLKNWNITSPDFFSLDIDFWILKDLLKNGFLPSIICIEYLSYYGKELVCSVKKNLNTYSAVSCGASLEAFKKILSKYNYKFFTVDSKGINAFFYLDEKLHAIDDIANFTWMSCKRYWDVPIPSINDSRIVFDENILLG